MTSNFLIYCYFSLLYIKNSDLFRMFKWKFHNLNIICFHSIFIFMLLYLLIIESKNMFIYLYIK